MGAGGAAPRPAFAPAFPPAGSGVGGAGAFDPFAMGSAPAPAPAFNPFAAGGLASAGALKAPPQQAQKAPASGLDALGSLF